MVLLSQSAVFKHEMSNRTSFLNLLETTIFKKRKVEKKVI